MHFTELDLVNYFQIYVAKGETTFVIVFQDLGCLQFIC